MGPGAADGAGEALSWCAAMVGAFGISNVGKSFAEEVRPMSCVEFAVVNCRPGGRGEADETQRMWPIQMTRLELSAWTQERHR